jgi:protein-S-isoprenylcysteine O-methyltransferase Ste14
MVIGRYQMEDIGKTIYIAGLILLLFIRATFILKKKNTKKNIDRKSFIDILMLILILCAAIIIPLVYIISPWVNFADYHLPFGAAIFGIIIFIISLIIFLKTHIDLGKNWHASLEIKDNHTLITNGIYKTIRHPMYSSFALWSIAQCLLLQNFIAGFSTLVIDVIMYFIRVPKEEQMMLDQFGDEYREYMKRTGRLFPKIF